MYRVTDAEIRELAHLEQLRWPDLYRQMGPLIAADLLSVVGAARLYNFAIVEDLTWKIQLHTGNPGPAGNENKAAENARKSVKLNSITGRHVGNGEVVEWVGVKANETYKFFSLWVGGGEEFAGYGELVEPIAVLIGDTFKFPIKALEIEVLET